MSCWLRADGPAAAANLVGNPMPTQALQAQPGQRMLWLGSAVLLAVAMNIAVGLPAWAQHRVVEPDGRITYTDRPLSYEQVRPGGERTAGEGFGTPPGRDWTAGSKRYTRYARNAPIPICSKRRPLLVVHADDRYRGFLMKRIE